MKSIHKYVIMGLMAVIYACTPMDETYKEFQKDGPIVYLAMPQDIQAFSGKSRIEISLGKQPDPRIRHAKIYWNNKADYLDLDIDPNQPSSVIIPGLEESPYAFNVNFYDDNGHYSLPVELLATSYGSTYAKYLANRVLDSYDRTDTELSLKFAAVSDTTMVGTYMSWLDEGEEKNMFFPGSQNEVSVGPSVLTFDYYSVYRPTPTAIDTFHTKTATSQIPYRIGIALNAPSAGTGVNPVPDCQLYCAEKNLSYGTYFNLFDNSDDTYFATLPNKNYPHNLDFTLDHPSAPSSYIEVSNFEIWFRCRPGQVNNNPSKLVFYASEDGSNWTEVHRIESGIPTTSGGEYTTGQIDCPFPAKYIRMSVLKTTDAGNGTCHLSELRLYTYL